MLISDWFTATYQLVRCLYQHCIKWWLFSSSCPAVSGSSSSERQVMLALIGWHITVLIFDWLTGSQQVFRIHWIMASLVFLKSLSLFFHGVNYNKIATHGIHVESWAILYYITHLLKGGLLFFTIGNLTTNQEKFIHILIQFWLVRDMLLWRMCCQAMRRKCSW